MTLSVLMPVRNRIEQLKISMPSIIAQHPDEIVAVDDGSTDGSTEFLKEHATTYVRREQEKYKASQGATWTACAEAASGDVFVWQNAEVYHPLPSFGPLLDRLEPRSIAFGVVYDCAIENLPNVNFPDFHQPDWEMKGHKTEQGRLSGGNPQGCRMYCGPGRPVPWMFFAAMHRATWERIGPFPETGKTDVGFALQALKAGVRFLGAGKALGIHLSHEKK